MTDTVALLLAGGHVGGYGVLTHNRTKAALPFAGHYRVIDFALSNLSNSGVNNIGLITQYLPASLIEHVGGGDAWDLHGYGRMVKIMPPFVGIKQTTWFRGTTDAINRNMNFVYDLDPENVIILSGEHIFNMDFRKPLEFHREKDAELTIVGQKLPKDQLSLRFGYIRKDKNQRVTLFKEKPREILSDFISIGIYIFKKDVLLEEFERRGEHGPTQNLVFDIIEPIATKRKVFTYEFNGYWNYLKTVNDYCAANMLLLKNDPPIKLSDWEIITNLEDRSLGSRNPLYLGANSSTCDSLISPGCKILGGIKGSILSPGVVIEEGAVVEDSIIMHDCIIKKGAWLKNVIADKNAVFEKDCIVGGKSDGEIVNPELPKSTKDLTIIGKGVVIGENVEIGPCSQVYPDMNLNQYKGTRFAPGLNIN